MNIRRGERVYVGEGENGVSMEMRKDETQKVLSEQGVKKEEDG